MPDVGVAVAGTGFIGPVHVEALRRAGATVVGILGSSPEKSARAAAALGIPRAYRDFADLLADPGVDSVHITVPNRLHFDMAKQALAAGKHVLCEKPLAMNSQESAELVRIATAAGKAAGVNYNIRYYPLCHEAAARARDGRLGSVYHVSGSYVQDWLFHPTDFNWRVEAEEGGELRAVADIGTHWLDLIEFVTGLEVESVCADLQTVFPERQRPLGSVKTFSGKLGAVSATEPVPVHTEDAGNILLRLTGGARGSLSVSQVTAGRKNGLCFEIAGSSEALAWNSERPNELWIGHRDAANELVLRDPSLLSASARAICDYPGGHNEGFPDTFKQLFHAFYGYIRAGDFSAPPPFPTFADGHREILVCEAILASHRGRCWVDIKGTNG